MNQQELKYVKQRASEIFLSRRKALNEKHTTKAVSFNHDQIFQKLKSGEYKLRDAPADRSYGSGTLRSYFDFGETQAVTDYEALAKDEAALKTEFDALMDELILGDQIAAIELLRKFASGA